jgi:hypothetical protein
MQWQAKPRCKKILEDHSFVGSRLWNGLRTRSPAIAPQVVLCIGLQRQDAHLFHFREPKIECYPGGSSRNINLCPVGLIRLGRYALRAPRSALAISGLSELANNEVTAKPFVSHEGTTVSSTKAITWGSRRTLERATCLMRAMRSLVQACKNLKDTTKPSVVIYHKPSWFL